MSGAARDQVSLCRSRTLREHMTDMRSTMKMAAVIRRHFLPSSWAELLVHFSSSTSSFRLGLHHRNVHDVERVVGIHMGFQSHVMPLVPLQHVWVLHRHHAFIFVINDDNCLAGLPLLASTIRQVRKCADRERKVCYQS